MQATVAATESNHTVALFDLDGTLTWSDTLLPFLGGYLKRQPRNLVRLWRLPILAFRFCLDQCRGDPEGRGHLKSELIRTIMGHAQRDAVNSYAATFVSHLQASGAFRAAALHALEAHRAAGHHLVLLSASPDLYVPRIGALLGFELTLCTEIAWQGTRLDGHLLTANRQGEEKVRCLAQIRSRYPGLPIIAYANSSSDLLHMSQADQALLVNGSASANRSAGKINIPTAHWR